MPLFSFYTPLKTSENQTFFIFSGGTDGDQDYELGKLFYTLFELRININVISWRSSVGHAPNSVIVSRDGKRYAKNLMWLSFCKQIPKSRPMLYSFRAARNC